MQLRVLGILAAAGSLVAVAALASACGGSSSSSKTAVPTKASGGTTAGATAAATAAATKASGAATAAATAAATEASGVTAAATASSSGGGGHVDASDACSYFTDAQVGEMVGTSIDSHEQLPSISNQIGCRWDGGGTQAVFQLIVRTNTDAGAAHDTFATKASIPGATSVSGVGDEAFSYSKGNLVEVVFRKGATQVSLVAGTSSASIDKLQQAAGSIAGDF